MIVFLSTLFFACSTSPDEPDAPVGPVDPAILASISPENMREHLDVLASDAMGGRVPGSLGHAAARAYILDQMADVGLEPLGDDGYEYRYENSPSENRWMLDEDGAVQPQATEWGYDFVGLVPGSDPELSDEYLVVMAHYDHLGVTEEGEIYNGAFDNASAVAMALELARVMRDENAAPGRSVVFLFTDDEETGLVGSREWIGASTVPREDIIFGVSADPLGRGILPDYKPIVLMGLDRSPSLRARWEQVAVFSDEPVVFVHRDAVPVFSSDQDPWYELEDPIPAVWFTNPGMSFYHTPADDSITIDYGMMLASARHLLEVLTDLGGDDERYAFTGPGPLDGQMASDAGELLGGVMASTFLTGDERIQAQFLLDKMQVAIDADSVEVLDSWEGTFFAAAYFLLIELPTSHPGVVPPPWPDGFE
jgi:hypothetical protein